MNTTNIFKSINQELEEFKTRSIKIAENYEFNQKKTINENIRMYNSQFESGKFDSEGFQKFFNNIVKAPCNTATKAIKFDPKHIQIKKRPGQSDRKVWLMNRDFSYWMKEQNFAEILSKIFYSLPIMGSAVLKIVNGKPYMVDLRNLVNEQAADSLKDASYVIEQHYYTVSQLRKQNWDKNKIKEVIDAWRNTDEKYIRVLERYGEVEDEKGEWTYRRVIAYVPDGSFYNGKEPIASGLSPSRGIVLDDIEINEDDFPYRDFHFEKIPGRWLGVGRVEILRDPQVRTNEITNLRVKSSYFSTLNIFQTMDSNFNKSLVHDVANGDVVKTMARIERIPTEERNLTAMDLEERKWLATRDEQTFTHDVVRGERLPAGTPLGSAQIAAAMIQSYFEMIQKDVASQIKKFVVNDVIPNFKSTKEHYINLIGDDLEEYQKLVIEIKWIDKLMEFIKKNNKIPSKSQADAMKQVIAEKQKASDIFIPAEYYKDVDYLVEIEITGQYKDSRIEAANNLMILQAIGTDPTLLVDPVKRKIFAEILESMGKNITDFGSPQVNPIEQSVQENVGGGISKASLPQNIQTVGTEEIQV
jgi:hypothetical protein